MFIIICWFFFIWRWMSFLTTSINLNEINPDISLVTNNDLIFDYDLVNYISNTLLLDHISPNLNYDMERYIDLEFIKSRPFFNSNFYNYDDYIKNIIIEIGQIKNWNEVESHIAFLCGALNKMYNLNYLNDNLSLYDSYILDWAKNNLSGDDIIQYRDFVINNPNVNYVNKK